MERVRALLLYGAIISIVIHTTTCNLEPTFSNCCNLGSGWASEGSKCAQFPAPVVGISAEQQSSCLSAVEICCIRRYREIQCTEGMGAAEDGRDCVVVNKLGGEHFKDCCEACKLGMISGSMGNICQFSKFSFGQPWDLAYQTCCIRTSPTTRPTSAFPITSTTAGGYNTSLVPSPTPVQPDSLCELLPGELCAHLCVPTTNSYTCKCRPGFSLMSDGKSCQQENLADRCLTFNPCAHNCIDTGLAIECSCRKGFQLASDERSCTDINECKVLPDACLDTQQCRNELGNYVCINPNGTISQPLARIDKEKPSIAKNEVGAKNCPVGYEFNYQSQVCDDIDECLLNQAECGSNALCQNTIASYVCVRVPTEGCRPGFRLYKGEQTCKDINECAEAIDNCNRVQQHCVNTEGSFRCQEKTEKSQCPAGYKYNVNISSCEDVDECAERLHGCQAGVETCRNTEGAYECDIQCMSGFQFDIRKQICEDADECLLGTSRCSPGEMCVNTIGGFWCSPQCGPGLRWDPLNPISCSDIDECSEGIDNCDKRREICKNTNGSFVCEPLVKCSVGFRKVQNTCEDVNECLERTFPCGAGQECVNNRGSFRCVSNNLSTAQTITFDKTCPAGFRYHPQRLGCLDINECEEQIYVCNRDLETCINEPGGYRCGKIPDQGCQLGFKLHTATNSCRDVDECHDHGDFPCDSNQNCINTHGSFKCSCKTGFELDHITQACADVNECQVNQHDCLPSQRCDNTIGSFQCIRFTSCGTGYTLNAESGLCEDDDECVLGTDTCRFQGPMFQCRNTLGSFRCERKRCEGKLRLNNAGECVPIGTSGSTYRTSSIPTTTTVVCPPGFQSNLFNQCSDINECELQNPCRRNQRCYNTQGSYRCINLLNCGGGFAINDLGTQCIDIDECATGSHECGRDQTCQNLHGGYVCQCPPGHNVTPSKECVDIDECTRYVGQVCANNAVCENTPGSYRCACKHGFKQGKDLKTCVDVNECEETPGLCHQTCVNSWGSYACTCNPGFQLSSDNRTCSDVDECARFKHMHLCVGLCINQPGSYSCQCPAGYKLGNDGRTCQDIDECLSDAACRSPEEICLNTRGSFKCNTINCPPNFVKDADHKNRCKRESLFCRENNQACLRLPMSYSFNFITFVSNYAIPPSGQLNLFTMRGPKQPSIRARFSLDMLDVHAPSGIRRISKNFFRLDNTVPNQAVIALAEAIPGPQEIELQLNMELHQNGVYGGSAVAKLFMNDNSIVCKRQCEAMNSKCIMNNTNSITYQYIAMPTIRILPNPMVLTRMQAVTARNSWAFKVSFGILNGNEGEHFDFLSGPKIGALRLTKPVLGPRTFLLHLQMDVLTQNVLTARHLALVSIDVSRYDF